MPPAQKRAHPNGIDIVCIRELTGGIYFGQPKHTTELAAHTQAVDTKVYRKSEIKAHRRGGDRHRPHPQNASVRSTSQRPETSVLWRKTVTAYLAKHARRSPFRTCTWTTPPCSSSAIRPSSTSS